MYILYRIFKIHCCCPSQFGFLHHDIPRMKAIASFIFLHHRYLWLLLRRLSETLVIYVLDFLMNWIPNTALGVSNIQRDVRDVG